MVSPFRQRGTAAMASRTKSTSSRPPSRARNVASPAKGRALLAIDGQANGNAASRLFSDMACKISHLAGKPLTFLAAVLVVVVWAASGPLFGFSDTWQLVINTSTTIITFLMVFLIQHTQNRDTLALQLKLAELIIAQQDAENRIATAEDLSEDDLEALHEDYRTRADATLEHLNRRRSEKQKQAG
jgi:low affinity Fe/Cu permease